MHFSSEPNLLRKQILEIRKNFHSEEKNRIFSEILSRLYQFSAFKDAKSICAYVGKEETGEFNTFPLLQEIIRLGKKLYLPRCYDSGIGLDLHEISNLSTDLELGLFGLQEPLKSLPKSPLTDLDMIIIPGLVFDKFGMRLGYGKGYYDSLIQKCQHNPPILLGLTYSFAIVDFQLVSKKSDLILDYLISEKMIYFIKD